MRLQRAYRSRMVYAGLLLGAALGLAGAELAARVLRLRDGERQLDHYAQRLEQTATQVNQEGEDAINTVLKDGLGFCSAEELRLMRGVVYNSTQIKDIGRIQAGRLVCSSGMGVLPEPVPMAAAKTSFRNMTIYGWTPVLFGERNNGFIVQVRDVDVVLNPKAFNDLREDSRSFAAYLFDSRTRTLIQGFGDRMPLTAEEVIAGGLRRREGVDYRSRCAAAQRVCVVAAESEQAMMAADKPFHEILLVAGASVGDTVVLAFFLLYRRQRSQGQQLRRAVRRKTLRVVYQPIVEIATRSVVGVEALARWRNEDGEEVPPDVFIAMAEKREFVVKITRLVVRTCLEELGDLLRAESLRLTVNITAQDLNDPSFLPFLRGCLREAEVEPAQMGLELTERTATNQPLAIETIAALRRAGHRVYIDDFGTGYSSLACLADLAADFIKIDRTFTASIGTHAITESILPQVLQMAEQLKLAVVAEGIETLEQARYFEARSGEILGQGWLFGLPMPALELRRRLEEEAEVSAELAGVSGRPI